MAFLLRLLIISILLCIVAAAPTNEKSKGECKKLGKRKAWHMLKDKEKKDYIDAELCLMSKPAKQKLPGAVTRFDELQALHQITTLYTHFVGAFLPFHRLFLLAHETFLREECNYKGYQPYWHEPMDAGNFINSPVLDPILGFGGNGSGPNLCITDGPFKDYTNHVGPYWGRTDHCLFRRINDTHSQQGAQEFVDECMAQADYHHAWKCIEVRPHNAGHGGMGGQMIDPPSSPGDPLFYLHHTWLDKLWWKWQALDLENRLTDMSGNNVMSASDFAMFQPPPPEDWPPSPYPLPGDPGNETTLSHILDMKGVFSNRTIAEVMDIRKNPFCYEYIEPA